MSLRRLRAILLRVIQETRRDRPSLALLFVAPIVITGLVTFIVRESEGKAWASSEAGGWQWEEREARIPYQSQVTTGVVESLLATGECGLAPLAESSRLHLALLEALRPCVRGEAPDDGYYPFT